MGKGGGAEGGGGLGGGGAEVKPKKKLKIKSQANHVPSRLWIMTYEKNHDGRKQKKEIGYNQEYA
jgi:hypothetical protein